ncbi:UNVERIFIED_CONTAM: phosphatidylinositol 4-kinase [Hammondia hammondi]|eukprot:XP_008882202.1 phosphatidylinositol 4-kinase [Hammondia hammondi]
MRASVERHYWILEMPHLTLRHLLEAESCDALLRGFLAHAKSGRDSADLLSRLLLQYVGLRSFPSPAETSGFVSALTPSPAAPRFRRKSAKGLQAPRGVPPTFFVAARLLVYAFRFPLAFLLQLLAPHTSVAVALGASQRPATAEARDRCLRFLLRYQRWNRSKAGRDRRPQRVLGLLRGLKRPEERSRRQEERRRFWGRRDPEAVRTADGTIAFSSPSALLCAGGFISLLRICAARGLSSYPASLVDRTLLPELIQLMRVDVGRGMEALLLHEAVAAKEDGEGSGLSETFQVTAEAAPGQTDRLARKCMRLQLALLLALPPGRREALQRQYTFWDALAALSGKAKKVLPASERGKFLKEEVERLVSRTDMSDMTMPLDPSRLLVRVLSETATPLQSAAKVPYALTFETRPLRSCSEQPSSVDGETPVVSRVTCIFKMNDDVRQDQLALQIIQTAASAFNRVGVDVWVRPYKVISMRVAASSLLRLPLSSSSSSSSSSAFVSPQEESPARRRLRQVIPSQQPARGCSNFAPNDSYRVLASPVTHLASREALSETEEKRKRDNEGRGQSCSLSTLAGGPAAEVSAAKATGALQGVSFSEDASALGGLIELIPDTISRHQIGKKFGCSLPELFSLVFAQSHENCAKEVEDTEADEAERGKDRVKEGRKDERPNPVTGHGKALYDMAVKNFVKSLAGYAVLSYILQVKDRHNGNLLISRQSGRVIHIDFGFVFDISPGHDMQFEKAPFKLTREMVQLMGGDSRTEMFRYFTRLCVQGYLVLREQADLIITLAQTMLHSGLPCFKRQSLENLKWRFQLEASPAEAAAFMEARVMDAYENFTTKAYDVVQHLQQGIDY